MTQMGPFEIVDPIEPPDTPARGGLLESVPVIEPLGDAISGVESAEKALATVLQREPADGAMTPEEQDAWSADLARARDNLEAANRRVLDARRWENGGTYRPAGGCADANVWAPCSGETKNVDPTAPLVEWVPYTVYAGFTCSTWALTEQERIGHAETRLATRGGGPIEAELWKGTTAIAEDWPTPFLASPAAVKLTGPGETSPLPYAKAALSDAIRSCLGSHIPATIHVTPGLAELWKREHMIDAERRMIDGEERDVLVDILGNVIVAGAGYDGSSPTGTVDPTGQTVWAYATGPVVVRRGPVYLTPFDTPEAVDRQTNDITWRAERSAVAYFDPCCLFGINVDLCSTTCS